MEYLILTYFAQNCDVIKWFSNNDLVKKMVSFTHYYLLCHCYVAKIPGNTTNVKIAQGIHFHWTTLYVYMCVCVYEFKH